MTFANIEFDAKLDAVRAIMAAAPAEPIPFVPARTPLNWKRYRRPDATFSPYRVALQLRAKDAVPALKVLWRLNRNLLRHQVGGYDGYEIKNHDVFVHFTMGGEKKTLHITPAGRLVGWVPRGEHINDRAHWLQAAE